MRIFLLILISAFGLQAATYYVDFTGGSDANNGTSTATPFKRSPGDANATGTAASTTLAAGDTVRFKGGVTYIGQIQISVSGATNNLISYVGNFDNGWGTGDSIIDGDATYYHAFETTAGEDFIRIDGLKMRNQKNNLKYTNAIVDRAGVTITNTYTGSGLITDLGVIRAYQGSRWWWIQNCHIYELEHWADRSVTNAEPDGVDATIEDVPCQQQTIYWYGSSASPNYGLTVSNCTFRGVGTAGLFIYRASQSLIISNDFGDISQTASNRGWFSVAGRVTDYCTNTFIIGNKTHNGWQYEGDDAFQRSHAGDWWHIYGSAQPPINLTFAWNKLWNEEEFTSNRGTSDGIYISDGTRNFYIRSNIFANPHPLRVIYVGIGSCDYTFIEHNTFVSQSLPSGAATHIRIDSSHGTNLVIRNNASALRDSLGLHVQYLRSAFAGTIEHNGYYSAASSQPFRTTSYLSFASWQSFTGGESGSFESDLGFTNWPADAADYDDLDVTPVEGSALIGAASDGGDIGAIPFSDEPPTPPSTIVTNNASGARVMGFRGLGMSVLPLPASSLLVDESFEGAGTPAGWTASGTPDFDNTSSPIGGAQDLLFSAGSDRRAYTSFSESGEVWIRLRLKMSAAPSSTPGIVFIQDAVSASAYVSLQVHTSRTLRLIDNSGANTGYTTDAVTAGTDVYVFIHIAKGTGSDAVFDLEWSTTSTRTGSGNKYVSASNGAYAVNSDYIDIYRNDSAWSTSTFQIDDVKVSNTGWPQ